MLRCTLKELIQERPLSNDFFKDFYINDPIATKL